jgi:hypothetical protein
VQAYYGAFRVLLHILVAITRAFAVMVLAFPGRTPSVATPVDASPAE